MRLSNNNNILLTSFYETCFNPIPYIDMSMKRRQFYRWYRKMGYDTFTIEDHSHK